MDTGWRKLTFIKRFVMFAFDELFFSPKSAISASGMEMIY